MGEGADEERREGEECPGRESVAMIGDYAHTVSGLRSRLRAIRQQERARMERAIAQRSEPVRAELAELTALGMLLRKRRLTLTDARQQVHGSRS